MRSNWLLWFALCVMGGVLLCSTASLVAQAASSQPSASADNYSRNPGIRVRAGVADFQTRQQQILSSSGPTVTNTGDETSIGKTMLIASLQAFFNMLNGLIAALQAAINNPTTPATIPVVTTVDVTSLTATTAVSGGNVTDNGGAAVTARGVCWNTSGDPTIADNHTSDGNGLGAFVSAITGLTPNTTYHVRAYATNIAGTGYGVDIPFTTVAGTTTGLPVISTTPGSVIGAVAANSGGNVTSDGGSAVTARGVCWSTSLNPTIADSHTTDGSGVGVFPSVLTGLTPATTYHVRAYATNANGTSYGEDLTITTTSG
jgi:hypothetical protein